MKVAGAETADAAEHQAGHDVGDEAGGRKGDDAGEHQSDQAEQAPPCFFGHGENQEQQDQAEGGEGQHEDLPGPLGFGAQILPALEQQIVGGPEAEADQRHADQERQILSKTGG